MAALAFLGLGAMGSRMALRLLGAGHRVTVWNRSPAAADALRRAGAGVADTPRAAVREAATAFAMVRDDAASRAVWLDGAAGALDGMAPDALAIESSTLTVEWVRVLAGEAFSRGVAFLDAPVVGSRPQAEAGQLIHMVGGEAAAFERATPLLGAMSSAAHHLGGAGAGAAVKLAVNVLFGVQVATAAELLGFLRRSGVDPARAVAAIGATPVASPASKAALGGMLAGNFAPMFPVELVAKDFAYALASGTTLPMTGAARDVFATVLAQGLGDANLTAVAKLYGDDTGDAAG